MFGPVWGLPFDEATQQRIQQHVDFDHPPVTGDDVLAQPEILQNVDFIFASWGMVKLDEIILQHAPRLKAIFYAAGSIRYFATDAMWARDIRVSSAYAANSIPVSEFTFAEIIFSLKRGWEHMRKQPDQHAPKQKVAGCYKSTVGIISLGMIGRAVCERLKSLDVNVIAYDPFADDKTANELNVTLCSLEDIFRQSDVVSLHTPWLKETEKMINAPLFMSMKPHGIFINTARGAVVDEDAMIQVLQQRTDLMAVLDVTWPEPPVENSPLYTMDNIILTPHIAGSMDNESGRMGEYMADELDRYIHDQPLQWEITKEKAAILA